ncbi:hypothetical protein NEOLI_005454 [Neolecta irregularis DAH-3]|uniref:NADH dehydrogenase [ubiquinone] 1 alpha subcomplex subunit 1 n=1 Tax=Neolecta irregularis (strain DAH-3) TaxID=1198029 RepID=A0A1U7LMC2_NEOID|nr:hypothetical protein NEOLI_005454 [Neolecta irregularis DAH-3]|eukprot:OLL23661.1 hypothetical protein NEOLI_005454 [Neolecta irregularis DAH-3]
MPVPFEALLPVGIIIGMFGLSGGLVALVRTWENDGKPPRWNTDAWDEQMMLRDKLLTGHPRGQQSDVIWASVAPRYHPGK